MKNLDELLNKKIEERAIKEREFQKERAIKEREFQKAKATEQERLQLESIQKKESERIARNKESINSAIIFSPLFGATGAFLGVIIGFGKGCANYVPATSPLSAPFWYIPEMMLTLSIIGALLGLLVGIIIGQFK